MKSRKRLFLVVVAVAVAFGAAGYLLGQQLESPEDARAEVAEPEPSLIAVPVESVALSNDVVVRGDAEFEGAVELELDPSLGDGASRVVTGRVPEVDTEVNEGDVIIEVSGRPVFVLGGPLPAFREFAPGLEGDDVLQLEEALARLGYLDVTPDGLYGAATEQAIRAMYADAGYEPRAESEQEETQLDIAEDAVDAAREALANASDRLDDLRQPPSQVEIIRDREERERLTDAIADAEEALEDAEEALAVEEANFPSISYTEAVEAVQRANELSDEAAQIAAQRSLLRAQDADTARMKVANDAVERAEGLVEDAIEALADYDELEAAEDAEGTDTSDAEDAVVDAEDRLAEAEADLAELEDDIGVRLPSAEIVFLPDLPRTITAIDTERGDFVNGSVMRISGTEVRITTGVSEANRPLLEVGQRVIIDSEQLGIEVEGEIAELADRTGTNDVSDTRYYMLVIPTGEYNVSEMVGVNFRLQIPLEKSEGEVLAVPLAALSAGADGTSRVEVLNDDETTSVVPVEVGLQDKNRSLVEIVPIEGSIGVGDLVVIGVQQTVVATDEAAESDGG